MEIERKFLIKEVPADIEKFPHVDIEQAYVCRGPVIRVRKKAAPDGISYVLTVKGSGMLAREEMNLKITAQAYDELYKKASGPVIKKRRYLIPLDPYVIELDRFESPSEGLWLAEVEFPSVDEAKSFTPPEWFLQDVTDNPAYHNANMR